MADKSYSKVSYERYKTITLGKLGIVVKADEVSENDTVTVSELSAIDFAKAVVLEDGSEATVSIATNVVTITEAGLTDKDVFIMLVGTVA